MNIMLAAISGGNLMMALVWVVVAAVLWILGNWAIGAAGIGEPFSRIAKIIVVLVVLLVALNGLMILVGRPLF